MLNLKNLISIIMNKLFFTGVTACILLTSCVSKKIHTALEDKNKKTQELLDTATMKLNLCLEEKAAVDSKAEGLESQMELMAKTNSALLNNVGNLATLSTKEAENLERSLESIKEKDLQIRTMRDAITKKDSVTLALVTSIKGALGNLQDEDIEVNVEKGVVFISISDKLLFKSGSYNISDRAKTILGKVATVVNNKPDIEFMVEGHTDDVPYKSGGVLIDNWDLSVKRATAVVRVLQNDFKVAPNRMTAAGRGEYVPVSSTDKSSNRRTRIVILPKLDQFYNMVEEGMKKAPK